MNERALSIFDAERARGFRNLAGTHLETTLPVTQHLVDMAVARASARRNLHGLQVTLRGDGAIGVEVVKPVLGFGVRLALVFRIAGPVDVRSDPRVYLLANPSLTWTAMSRLATAAGLAPAGVSIGLDGVAIDLRALAARAGVEDLLSLARRIELEGREGALVVRVAVDVPEGGVARGTAPDPDRASAPQSDEPGARTGWRAAGDNRDHAAARTAEVLRRELKGARVQGQVQLAEELANRALRVALQSARDASARGGGANAGAASRAAPQTEIDGSTVARWIQRAQVQFVNGRLVLDVDVVIT
jgi:hypothetical protein